MTTRLLSSLRRLRRDRGGAALLEFGFILPVFALMGAGGAELTNYITVRMRVSQLALQLADNAARIGTGSQLAPKTISEQDINDLLTGADLQAGDLNLYTRGRVIISSLEPVKDSNPQKYVIRWQRCRGIAHASGFGTAGTTQIDGMGPPGRQVIAPKEGVTMFVEVYYQYRSLLPSYISMPTDMTQYASLMVRDRRDTTGGTNGVYQVSGVTPSTC
jgi:hypothetical protein